MQFDFGQNWVDFSHYAVTPQHVLQARGDFQRLAAGLELRDKTFLDLGFGQGFSLLTAASLGAVVIGCDINPKCQRVLDKNRVYFPEVQHVPIPIVIGSILDDRIVETLRRYAKNKAEGFDIVHSWGVLHHTGNMRKAIQNSLSLVKPGGYFLVALYNRHWSSASWLCIKWLYCFSPPFLKKLLVYFFYPVIGFSKYLVTGENPKKKSRGMDFFFDVVDWVGGYPYEYASKQEVLDLIEPIGFKCLRFEGAEVPTGNNQFVFKKK